MTGRRAVGTLLHRAARGAALDVAGAPLNTCRGACGASLGGDGARGAVHGIHHGAWKNPTPVQSLLAARAASSFPASTGLSPATPTSSSSSSSSSSFAVAFTSFAASEATPPPSSSSSSSPPESLRLHPDGAGPAPARAGSQEGPSPDLLALRGHLIDSLTVCLGLQQLDALLARQENRAAFDEMLLVMALDTAHRLCSSSLSSLAPTAALAAAASDSLTRLSELLIQLLSEPGALSPEGAVRALRTMSVLRFNPAGDYAGLQAMAAFYREAILPQLDLETAGPELAARSPQMLVDLFFAFSRLFEVAARRERDLQAQLLSDEISADEAAARRADDEEAAAAAGAAEAAAALPPWQRVSSAPGAAAADGLVLGDRQLYLQLSRMLAAPGALSNVPTKSLGTLASAMAASRFAHYPLAQSIATQTLLRLQGAGAAGAAAAAGLRQELSASGNDAMATSTLSNIVSCLAKLGFEHEALCDATANWMLQRLHGGGAAAAAAAAATAANAAMRGTSSVVAAAGGGVVSGVEPHHIVDVAVAFARVKYDNMDYLLRASQVLQLKLSQSSPNSVAMMAWAVANSKSGRSPDFAPLLNALAQRMVALHRYTLAHLQSRSSAGGASAGGGGGAGGMFVVPRHMACIAFAMARVGQLQPRLLDAVAADVVTRPGSYQARQLSNVLRAFTLLDSYRPDMYDAACAVLEQRLRAARGQSATSLAAAPAAAAYVFSAQNYADIAWSAALAGHAPHVPELMDMLADRIAEVAPQVGKACLVRAAQAFAVAGTSSPRLFDAIAQASRPLLVDLGPGYLASMVDAFAELQHPVTEEFWLSCMDAVGLKVPHMERPRPDMQAAAARLAAAFRRHPATQEYAACRGHYVLPLLDALAPEQQHQ